jgi:hypothetical protein
VNMGIDDFHGGVGTNLAALRRIRNSTVLAA